VPVESRWTAGYMEVSGSKGFLNSLLNAFQSDVSRRSLIRPFRAMAFMASAWDSSRDALRLSLTARTPPQFALNKRLTQTPWHSVPHHGTRPAKLADGIRVQPALLPSLRFLPSLPNLR